MELDVRPQTLSLVVGKKENEFLKIELDVQKNHFKMNLINLSPISVEKVLEDFNSIEWLDKISSLLKNTSQKEDSNYYNVSDVETIEIVVNHVKKLFDVVQTKTLLNTYEIENNISEYDGDSIPLVKWLYSFSNRILDDSIMEFVPQIIQKIKEVDMGNTIVDINDNLNEELNEKYFLYIGDKQKYKGCVGKLTNTRELANATYLLEFAGKKEGKSTGRMWCSLDNLVLIN